MTTQPFGGPVIWDPEPHVLQVAATRSFNSVLQRIEKDHPDWVVVVRTSVDSSVVYHYVFRPSELLELASKAPDSRDLPIEQAVHMHEWTSSRTSRGRRPVGPGDGLRGPAASRIVDYDASGHIAAIGERKAEIGSVVDQQSSLARPSTTRSRSAAASELRTARGDGDLYRDLSEGFDVSFPADLQALEADLNFDDLGPMRGGSGITSSARPTEIEVTLSAEIEAQIDVGSKTRVPFQIELTSEALPLEQAQTASAQRDKPIIVSLSLENENVALVQKREFTCDPPVSGEPRSGFFTVKGVREGVCRIAVSFRQGGSDLGVVSLAVDVVAAGAGKEKAQGTAVAQPRDTADDDKLALIIELRTEGNQSFYEYTMHSEALGLPYRHVRSKPLLDRGGGAAATTLAFVERIYERVTKELQSRDDLNQLQREARALGASLCQELFDPEVTKLLWPLRDRLHLVQIVSWEPYIPWELVRLRDPSSGEIDERFLCEYGMVRTLSDGMPVRALQMEEWAYLGASFPMGSYQPVGRELDFFTTSQPEGLKSHGITPKEIATTRDAFYDALANGEFDVLHISCHAESQHESIDQASLIISDETVPGSSKPRLVAVDTVTVEAEARLGVRRPLVFLNACETGRVGAVLTAWGGWPNVFLRKGAGAFVGTSWSVRDKPAALFSTTFYNALLDGKNLAEAASAARAAAKTLGDVSWLAFKVYGHPRARRGP
jgi:hypothetical protein